MSEPGTVGNFFERYVFPGTAWSLTLRILVAVVLGCALIFGALWVVDHVTGAISNYFTDSAIAAKKKKLDDLNAQLAAGNKKLAEYDALESAKKAEIAQIESDRLTALADKLAADKARDESVAATNKLIADLAGFKGKKNVTAAEVECAVLGNCK